LFLLNRFLEKEELSFSLPLTRRGLLIGADITMIEYLGDVAS
jgi:hypothetical protein